MANSFSALAPVNFMPMVQVYLNARLVAKPLCRTEFKDKLRSGQTIDWPYITDLRVQTYTPGTDLTIDAQTAASNTMAISDSRAATFTLDPNQQAQAEDKSVQAELADQAAYRIASDIDQKVLSTAATAATAANTITGGVLAAGTLYSQFTSGMAILQRNAALNNTAFAVVDPETVALLAQVEVANGFNLADSALKNGFVGPSHAGFNVYSSNNLPTTVTLGMATIPTDTDTTTVFGVLWTWVANAAAAAAGDISIGANVAAARVNWVNAINGTGTPGASTYIDVSVEDRRILQNAGASAATFVGANSVLTGFGKISASETLTAAADGFTAETGSMLMGVQNAMSLGMQIMPEMYVGKEPKRPESNYIIHTLFGRKVFERDIPRLVKLTRTVTAATV